jgi:hypothetical protein
MRETSLMMRETFLMMRETSLMMREIRVFGTTRTQEALERAALLARQLQRGVHLSHDA